MDSMNIATALEKLRLALIEVDIDDKNLDLVFEFDSLRDKDTFLRVINGQTFGITVRVKQSSSEGHQEHISLDEMFDDGLTFQVDDATINNTDEEVK